MINPEIKIGRYYRYKNEEGGCVGKVTNIFPESSNFCSIKLDFGGKKGLDVNMWSKDGYDLVEATDQELRTYLDYLDELYKPKKKPKPVKEEQGVIYEQMTLF